MKATVMQTETHNLIVSFNSKTPQIGPPLHEYMYGVSPAQCVVLALINQYATKIELFNGSYNSLYYVRMAAVFSTSKRLRTFLELLEKNQILFASIKFKELEGLLKHATIENIHHFLSVKKLLATELKTQEK